MTIAQATIEDLDSITKLFDNYRVFYGQPSNLTAAREFISQRIHNKESIIFIAKNSQGQTLGFTQLFPTFSSVGLKKVYILNDLYVEEAHRKQGVAQSILNKVTTYCDSIGIARLQLCTAIDNLPAKTLYESNDWKMNKAFDYYSLEL